MNQSEFEDNACNRRQARENACERGTIGFGLISHWLKKWREFCEPITERRKAKPKQLPNYFRHPIENRSKLNYIRSAGQETEEVKNRRQNTPRTTGGIPRREN